MPGPPPTPTYLKLLRENPGRRPLRPEPEPPREPECPAPPPFLAPYARDEWWRVAPSLHALHLLSLADTAALSAYCQMYSHWRTAEETLAKMAANDPVMNGLVIKAVDGTPPSTRWRALRSGRPRRWFASLRNLA